MKHVDYIIVGCGLAGIAFCEELRALGKTFCVFDNNSQQSSLVAAGLYNPVILKRFTKVWKSKEQLALLDFYYTRLEKLLDVKLDYKFPILRKFSSVEEQNLWFQATDKPGLEPYLSLDIKKNTNPNIEANFGFGTVKSTGRIETSRLIYHYKKYLKSINVLIEETFDYSVLVSEETSVIYKDYTSKHIVFAEGFGIRNNPFFNHLPLYGTKGEVLTIKAPKLQLDYAIKSSVFIIPEGNDTYRVGSTYNRDDKTNKPTVAGKKELVSKLETLMTCEYEIIDHKAGVRPTVKDRRPLIGRHHQHQSIYLLNGLGSRGVMVSPYISKQLYAFIEHNEPLNPEINCNRFNP
ncbi:FAD-binding oxidoreductase [Ichthyenterobacterium sp. W332]|uniref:FAD-binding oxidoreductase n=1 Tax=Microcosmobacter mediterraneus TaxID=3075607 RepID=A0ABU2YNX1_9FLAO|nr:FAD-binding oxidoreductase [Ichthyenterobacterium sp. W332]MDT0559586.1 FAD-binding oxidoreductase [Ichthyenterobacterium sp. W332]